MTGYFLRGCTAWLLYLAGASVHRWNDSDRRFTERGYYLYQRLMLSASRVQGDQDFGPWWPSVRR